MRNLRYLSYAAGETAVAGCAKHTWLKGAAIFCIVFERPVATAWLVSIINGILLYFRAVRPLVYGCMSRPLPRAIPLTSAAKTPRGFLYGGLVTIQSGRHVSSQKARLKASVETSLWLAAVTLGVLLRDEGGWNTTRNT